MSAKSHAAPSTASALVPEISVIKSELDDPDNIDARLQHLNRNVLPRSPYLLTVPSNCPYRVHHQQANNWKVNSPFDADEEGLQYMSFLYRDWDESILVARGDWDSEGHIMETGTASRNELRSGTSTPSQALKKKITLSAYKSKPKVGASGQGAQANDHSEVRLRPNTESKDNDGIAISLPRQYGQKRPVDAPSEYEEGKPSSSHDSARPAKKIKATPPRDPTHRRATSQSEAGQSRNQSTRHSSSILPPLLSPTLPASIEEGLAKLPRSPLDIEGNPSHKKTPSTASATSDIMPLSSGHTSSPTITNGYKATGAANALRSSPQTAGKLSTIDPFKGKAKVGSKAQLSEDSPKKLLPISEPRLRVIASSEAGIKGGKTNVVGAKSTFFESLKTGKPTCAAPSPTSIPRTEALEPKKTFLVRLKYPKSRRKMLERILQMKPRPQKVHAPTFSDKPKGAPAKTAEGTMIEGRAVSEQLESLRVAGGKVKHDERGEERHRPSPRDSEKASIKDQPKLAEKRPRPADGDRSREPPAKRQKPLASQDGSSNVKTPAPPAFKSPAMSSQGSAQKSQISPPKKDLKSIVMRRVNSADGSVRTPQGAARYGTPTAPSSAEKVHGEEKGAPSHSSKGRLKEIEAWRAENKKYTELGRKMKHEADNLLKPRSDGAPPDDTTAKQGVVLAIETALCYMLAFHASDQSRSLQRLSGDAQSWRSILRYLAFVTAKSEKHSHLHGLCFQIGAVCREIIHALDTERLKSDPLPVAAAEDVQPPTPGTDHNPSTGEIDGATKAATYRKAYLAFQAELVENAHEAKLFWAEGACELTVDDLQSTFPQTWAQRSKQPLRIAGERLVPGQYQGSYFLPLAAFSSGLEAVRFAYRLLGEWTRNERVDWRGRLDF